MNKSAIEQLRDELTAKLSEARGLIIGYETALSVLNSLKPEAASNFTPFVLAQPTPPQTATVGPITYSNYPVTPLVRDPETSVNVGDLHINTKHTSPYLAAKAQRLVKRGKV